MNNSNQPKGQISPIRPFEGSLTPMPAPQVKPASKPEKEPQPTKKTK